MMTRTNKLELLSPAKNITIAKQAILHGADAVYIGGPHFGARHNAGNSIQDIANLVEFAHHYYAKVFVTLNTILHNNELELAQKLIHQLYDAGIDALIVQDMGILQLDLPPIDLHASTQTDIRSVEKAQFLSDVGFSQIVLARELSLKQISKISSQVDANIEYFIHGALCVAFSGQCYISHAQTGRSANRGDCSQACRLPYTLKDEQGSVIAYEKHLLSMKDNNQSANLIELVDAGVRSFKIEGRYKDVDYVKNITAFYRQKLDEILTARSDLAPSASGKTAFFFSPDPQRTFHRGSTDYFTHGRQMDIGAFDSPKFVGIQIGSITKVATKHIDVNTQHTLTNGDGFNALIKREISGFRADKVEKIDNNSYRIYPNELPPAFKQIKLPHPIQRNLDHAWQQQLVKSTTSERRIAVDITLRTIMDDNGQAGIGLVLTSEEGMTVEHSLIGEFAVATQPEKAQLNLHDSLAKLGQTYYYARKINFELEQIPFIPNSQLNPWRREAMDKLTQARCNAYVRRARQPARVPAAIYPDTELTYLANVYNDKAKAFYHQHGVKLIDEAYEAHQVKEAAPVMITKHCLRFAFNLCPKQSKEVYGERNRAAPMQLIHHNETLTLKFDCKACEMQVWGKINPKILKTSLLGSELIFIDKT